MRMLICAFVVRMWHVTHFLMARLMCICIYFRMLDLKTSVVGWVCRHVKYPDGWSVYWQINCHGRAWDKNARIMIGSIAIPKATTRVQLCFVFIGRLCRTRVVGTMIIYSRPAVSPDLGRRLPFCFLALDWYQILLFESNLICNNTISKTSLRFLRPLSNTYTRTHARTHARTHTHTHTHKLNRRNFISCGVYRPANCLNVLILWHFISSELVGYFLSVWW